MAAGVEISDINWIGLVAALVFSIILGFIWFSPKTPMGRVWIRGMGMDPNHMPRPPGGKMAVSMLIMVIGSFLTWFVLAHTSVAYNDSYRLDCTGDNTPAGCDGAGEWDLTLMDGVQAGFFTWLGFFLPLNLGAVAWENKSWGFALNTTAYYLIMLVVGGIFLVTL